MSGIIGGAGSRSGIIGETEPYFEEGTWTPTISLGITSPTYPTDGNIGYYTRLGTMVFFQFWISLNGGAANGSQLRVSGLPFVCGVSGSELSSHNGKDIGGKLVTSYSTSVKNGLLPCLYLGKGSAILTANCQGNNLDYFGNDLLGGSGETASMHWRVFGQYVTT
mgnify:CR=1 FL=1